MKRISLIKQKKPEIFFITELINIYKFVFTLLN